MLIFDFFLFVCLFFCFLFFFLSLVESGRRATGADWGSIRYPPRHRTATKICYVYIAIDTTSLHEILYQHSLFPVFLEKPGRGKRLSPILISLERLRAHSANVSPDRVVL